MIRLALALAAAFFVACNGCNHSSAPPPAPSTPQSDAAAPATADGSTEETVVHSDDDGKTFDVAKGSLVTFKLASNAGTGYAWTPGDVDATVLAQQGERTNEIASDVPGAPKLDVYRFSAQNTGSASIEMDLKRPWGHAPPAKSIHVTINVH